jgi:hypothetical protein
LKLLRAIADASVFERGIKYDLLFAPYIGFPDTIEDMAAEECST